jgi:putative addiction module component (TIGR02574 family)
MPTQLELVEAQAMQLSPAERNHLLDRLIVSLDPDPAVEVAWEQLADQREADIKAGLSHYLPGDQVIAELRARLAAQALGKPAT